MKKQVQDHIQKRISHLEQMKKEAEFFKNKSIQNRKIKKYIAQ